MNGLGRSEQEQRLKSKKSDNAMTHGLYAREAVLPWEDAQAFADFHAEIRQELNPAGPLEEAAVHEVAELHWRKQRLGLSYLLQFHKKPPSAELVEAAKSGLPGLAAFLAEGSRYSPGAFIATAAQVLDYIKRAGNPTQPASGSSASLPQQSISVPTEIERAYDPAAMERYLKTEAMIDARITKIMGRLVGLKEYKKLYAQKSIEAVPPVASPPMLPAADLSAENDAAPAPIASTTKKRNWGDHE